jgi:lipoyl(octanoyl) transferase
VGPALPHEASPCVMSTQSIAPWVKAPTIKAMGRVPYAEALAAMKCHVQARTPAEPDELWWLQHDAVYTLGLQGARGHVHSPGNTPVVASDRGGHVTWHGPGQLVLYTLIDLKRRGLGVRDFVTLLEQAVIDALATEGCTAGRRPGAPGVYVDGAKVASLGLRVSRGISYHGLALNVTTPLEAFTAIDPCGMPGLAVTRTCDLGLPGEVSHWAERLIAALNTLLPEPAT